ncbi:SDR family oxidoreductase [Salinarimonas chemoclinalis]|uniref:SDR family oxidoreductase n=1 Tax=Salinarimonas chemoclinalis TaxID=3241599 RepID=UPI003556F673
MGGRLAGKRALVTGAGAGIGRAIALAFAAEGATVVAASRTRAKMEDMPRIHAAIAPVALDVTDPQAVTDALGAERAFDVVVNAAGWVHQGTLLACSLADWRASFDQNVTSAFLVLKATLPAMIAHGGGSIVNVASVASTVTGVAERAAYGASKAALIGLTKAVARDHIREGVRANALCPGTTSSPSLEARIAAHDDPEGARRRFVARQPMGRLGTVEEMAAAALYLASDDAAFVTGTVMVVDGGQTL